MVHCCEKGAFNIELRTLQCTIAPLDAYITQEGQSICNEFQLTVVSREAASVSVKMQADPPTDNTPVLSITCDWKDGFTSLCTKEDAAEIQVSPINSAWSVSWGGGGWLCTPPAKADLSKGFRVSFLFSNVVIRTKEHTAVLDLAAHYFPGFAKHSPAVVTMEKRYLMHIDYFYPDLQMVERGEKCKLSWSVRNATQCSISGEAVNLKGSKEVRVYADRQRFYLEVHNEFSRYAVAQQEIRLTNWKEIGQVQNYPLLSSQSASNHRMYEYNKELYACLGGKIYAADPAQGLLWREVSSAALDQVGLDYNTSILIKDELQILTAEKAYCYLLKQNKWENIGIRSSSTKRVACAAALLGRAPVFAEIMGKKTIQLSVFDRASRLWNLEYYYKVTDEIEELTGMDLIVHQGVLYLAASGQDEIYLYRSNDIENWTLCAHAAFEHSWFVLTSCGNRLFLLQPKGMVDLSGGSLYEAFPALPIAQTARVCTGVLAESMYLATTGAPGKTAPLLRFRP